MNILAIETSCDETATSVISHSEEGFHISSNIVSSQVALHAKWGGIVPSLAAREHAKNIVPVLNQAITDAEISPKNIDLVAVTNGPGLIPALLIGVDAAKTIAYAWKKPLIGIHHIAGHIYANFINSSPTFPILCLVVSGGHTQLVFMRDHVQYEIVGETQDDAVGEAFDKVARLLELGYPGGPKIAEAAGKINKQDSKNNIALPRPMMHSPNFNFSFSGLKTAVLYETKKNPELLSDHNYIHAMAHEFQQAAIDVLIHKTIKAAQEYNPKTIMIAGGVSANTELRDQLEKAIIKNIPHIKYQMPDIIYCGDNAAMIGVAAFFQWQKMNNSKRNSSQNNWSTLETSASLKMA